VSEPMTNGTVLERAATISSRLVASRVSRRSFFGRVGRGVAAASLGAAGTQLLAPAVALADACPHGCNCACSVSCNYLPGWGQNACPPDSCRCGHWCIQDSTCGNGIRKWTDCCGTGWCADHGGCYCVPGKNRPTCCNPRDWSGGDCSPTPGHIVCRTTDCVDCSPVIPFNCG
jgi:hypothetical protein